MTTPQPAVPAAHPAMFAALEVPNFRRYVSGQSLSLIGTWVETVAQALLVLRLTHSGIALGLTTAARYAPILLLSPYVPAIIRPLLMMALVGTFTFEFEVSLPLLAETTFHGSSTTYSALLGALGAGAVTGGLYAARSARTGVAPLIRAALGFAIAVGLVAAAPTLATAPGHRLVVDGPGRQHGDRLTGHRRAIGASRPAVWPRPRRRRLPRRRHHRRLARPRHPPRRPQPSGVAGQTRCRPARITRPRSGRCPGVRAQPGAGRRADERRPVPAEIIELSHPAGGLDLTVDAGLLRGEQACQGVERGPGGPDRAAQEQVEVAGRPAESLPEPLSQAEARVLRFLQTSLSAPEIASELYVSVNPVRTHMRHLYDKLGAHRRLEALDRARTLGLLSPLPQRA